MTDQEFLKKYGNERVEFSNIYKFRAIYKNEELKIWCSGVLKYRDCIEKTEMVSSIYDLEYFRFGVHHSNPSASSIAESPSAAK